MYTLGVTLEVYNSVRPGYSYFIEKEGRSLEIKGRVLCEDPATGLPAMLIFCGYFRGCTIWHPEGIFT
jgi:hypothetical protein